MKFFKLFFLLLIAFNTTASPSYLDDNKISAKEARALISKMDENAEFPVDSNELVLKQLNRLLGSPSGREHMRICLQRMKKYKSTIQKRIERKNVPPELMAIPLIESGYENKHSAYGWGSGLWMFIKTTGRDYGLLINDRVDQRLDVKRSTDAALTYLMDNYRRFKDWRLAILAYNMGESKLKKAIKKSKTRDPWELIRLGHERDKGYLAKVVAVVIIMNNKDLLL